MVTLVALCALGAEKVLANEIKKLGYKPISNAPGRVVYTCDKNGMFRSNLCLRTADRVYLQVAQFKADDFDVLFDAIQTINWQDYFNKDVRVIVDKVRTHRSKLSSEHSVQGMVHKAIYKKLGAIWRMEVLPESGAVATIRVYIENDDVQVLLDLSGTPLNKRGYRKEGGAAPIRETMAAILLQLMTWRRKTPLHDPFCGSGTIAAEAVLYAYDIAPGFGRRFALETLPIYNAEKAEEIKRHEAEKIKPKALARITGTDIDPQAVEIARANAERACVTAGRALQLIGDDSRIQRPDFEVSDFTDLHAPYSEGIIIANPPYGERLGDAEQAENLYKNMASLFVDFPDWEMGFITSHKKLEELIGKKATKKRSLKAGSLDTCFYMYTK
ncbi:MAG TPA: class I SAM-dependent RNA methyltransferase [Treponemataceae bacterium]|nr:class I SAM-dependent RNA methyltransferase [Treponemataceae bacterium]